MPEPTTTSTATTVGAGGALGTLLVNYFGAVGGELVMVMAMAIVGTSAGHALAETKPSLTRYLIALVSAIVSAGFLQPYTAIHPALIGAGLGVVLVAPKQNFVSIMEMVDRIRGVKK